MAADDPDARVTVRDAAAADAAAVAAIGQVAFPRTYGGLFHPAIVAAVVEQTYTREAVERSIRASEADPDAHFLVAERGGEVVGYADYTARPDPELHRIYVDPAATGGGIGGVLLAELHRRLPPGASYVVMVAAANTGAIRFYERHGFECVAEVDGLAHYREHMSVEFPADLAPVPALILRYTNPAGRPPS